MSLDDRLEFSPREVAERLGLAPSTLRTYAARFDSLLSPPARGGDGGSGGFAHRRYSAQDLRVLQEIKALLEVGLSYQAALRQLRGEASLVQPSRFQPKRRTPRVRTTPSPPTPSAVTAAAPPPAVDERPRLAESAELLRGILAEAEGRIGTDLATLLTGVNSIESLIRVQHRLIVDLQNQLSQVEKRLGVLEERLAPPGDVAAEDAPAEQPVIAVPVQRSWLSRLLGRG